MYIITNRYILYSHLQAREKKYILSLQARRDVINSIITISINNK